MTWRFGAAIVIAGLLPATALAVYYAVGAPAAIEHPAGAAAGNRHDVATLAAAADRIKAHLQQAPSDLKGWTLLGRTLAALERYLGSPPAAQRPPRLPADRQVVAEQWA